MSTERFVKLGFEGPIFDSNKHVFILSNSVAETETSEIKTVDNKF